MSLRRARCQPELKLPAHPQHAALNFDSFWLWLLAPKSWSTEQRCCPQAACACDCRILSVPVLHQEIRAQA